MTPRPSGSGARGFMFSIALVIALAVPMHAANAQTAATATAVQPRGFGYVLGDVLTQRILLRAGGERFEPAALPPLERTGAWLARRAASMETDGGGERWLVLEYQVINAPQTLTAIALPELSLANRTRGGALLAVAAWPVSVAPLTPRSAFAQGSLREVQPDRQPAPFATAPIARRLTVALAALALVGAAWLAWWLWRNRRDAGRLPFARACHALERFDPAQVDQHPDAWRHVHRALNDTAGQALHAGTLGALFVRAPYLEPLRERLEQFYAHSGARFFALKATPEVFRLLELCRVLRRAERQHRR